MAYFDARIGERRARDPGPETPDADVRNSSWKPVAHFAVQIGARPWSASGSTLRARAPESRLSNTEPRICPLCRGALAQEKGLYRCQGRCEAHWVETSPAHLVDLAALPWGVCACCEQPRPLVRGRQGAVCPVSGKAHLLLPDGATLLAEAAPHGICQCCVPPMPLLQQGDHLVCRTRPDNRYRRQGDEVLLVSTSSGTTTLDETWRAIDAALRHNNARVMVNGLFDVD